MLSFDDTEHAFAYKSTKDLKKAQFLFDAMGNPLLLKLGLNATPFAIRNNLPFTKGLIRSTIFQQFVGGETLEETAGVAQRLAQYNVQVILDYGVEGGDDGEAGYNHATEEFERVIAYASQQPSIPFMSIKVTGISRFGLLEKLDKAMNKVPGTLIKRYQHAVGTLAENEQQEWNRVVERFRHICVTAKEKHVGVLVDAEESWIQDPVDSVTMLMMDEFNKGAVVVYNTVQLYRHDRLRFLQDSHVAADKRGFTLGVKLVRGAYMEKERLRAADKGYASPIQPDKASTDADFNKAVAFCLENLHNTSVIVASHNERSNLLATQKMSALQIAPNNPYVNFSQLYGMSDNITFNLADAGYNVSKYLPFGPIKDVVPYLMRRATENSSVKGQTGRELSLIKKELARRQKA